MITDQMVTLAHAEYHKVLGDPNRSNPMRAALEAVRAATIEEFAREVEATDWIIPLQGDAQANEVAKAIALMVIRQAANQVRRIDWPTGEDKQ
jgi:HPt (histidine-containing phosphotransfer) domain-containing protein